MKNAIIPIIFLISIGYSLACEPTYKWDEDVIIEDEIIWFGQGADCNISISLNNTVVQNGIMNMSGINLWYNASRLDPGSYTSGWHCNISSGNTTLALFLGSCDFIVEGNMTTTYIYSGIDLGFSENWIALFFLILAFVAFAFGLIYATKKEDREYDSAYD